MRQTDGTLHQGNIVKVNGRRGMLLTISDQYRFPPSFWDVEYDDDLGEVYPIHASQITVIAD